MQRKLCRVCVSQAEERFRLCSGFKHKWSEDPLFHLPVIRLHSHYMNEERNIFSLQHLLMCFSLESLVKDKLKKETYHQGFYTDFSRKNNTTFEFFLFFYFLSIPSFWIDHQDHTAGSPWIPGINVSWFTLHVSWFSGFLMSGKKMVQSKLGKH